MTTDVLVAEDVAVHFGGVKAVDGVGLTVPAGRICAFGRALMSSPLIMMMDEPSMGLAPCMVDTVHDAVRRITDSGIASLVVEQNAELGLDIADHVVVVARGEVVFRGSAEQARADSSVVCAFLGEAALA